MWMISAMVLIMILMIVFSLTNASSQAEAFSEKHRAELQSRNYEGTQK